MNTEEISYVGSFFGREKKLYDIIKEKTIGETKIGALFKMTQNLYLTQLLYVGRKTHKSYFYLSDAIFEINENNVLLYIKEIDIYILFSNKTDFNNLNIAIYDVLIPNKNDIPKNTEEITYSPYQIVLSSQKQKMVFRGIGDDNDLQMARKFCEELFGCDTLEASTEHEKEITVNMTVDNLQEVKNRVEKLDIFLRKNSSFRPISRMDIYPPRTESICGLDYTANYIGLNARPDANGIALLNSLKYGFPETVNINITNNNINNITNNGNGVNIAPISGGQNNCANLTNKVVNTKEKVAREWVSRNLPNDGDSTTETHNRYKTENAGNTLSIKSFNNIIKENGYENARRSDTLHRWYKK